MSGTSLRLFVAAGGIAMLAACAGMGSPPSGGAAPFGASGAPPFAQFMPDKCAVDHGVSVKPCTVTLTTSKPSATVTVKSPKGSTISVADAKCTKKTIAEVEGTGGTWDVTAGTSKGSCDATFTAKSSGGKTIGTAVLSITNKL
jgi:hypothetical protein